MRAWQFSFSDEDNEWLRDQHKGVFEKLGLLPLAVRIENPEPDYGPADSARDAAAIFRERQLLYPQTLRWNLFLGEKTQRHYWLGLPYRDPEDRLRISATQALNVFEVYSTTLSSFILYFNDYLIDFSQPVQIYFNGKQRYNAQVPGESRKVIWRSGRQHGDVSFVYTCAMQLRKYGQLRWNEEIPGFSPNWLNKFVKDFFDKISGSFKPRKVSDFLTRG